MSEFKMVRREQFCCKELKQRVREAIKELEEKHDCPLEAGCCNLRTINELIKELGLEE